MVYKGKDSAVHVLIVDDDRFVREGLGRLVERAGHAPLEASDGKEALSLLEEEPVDLMLLDLDMPRLSGIPVLRQVVMEHPNVPVIIITGKGDIPKAVEATQLGAYDFLEKPVDAQRVLLALRNALEKAKIERQRNHLLSEVQARYHMVGNSEPMQRVYGLINQMASTKVRVLITGENGTGKELAARAIHHNSKQASGPFVGINCAAIPEELIESELFGHEKGAFTGASSQRKGKFEQAQGGTLFLDEVGDMSLMTQAKILRALEEKAIWRVGGRAPVRVDLRVVAATNKDLKEEIEEGNFREDLYYRLNVVHLHLPLLRDRWKDIPALVTHFMETIAEEHGLPTRALAPGALVLLSEYAWPGNVRQLRNVIERLMVLSTGVSISLGEVEKALEQPQTESSPEGQARMTLKEAREQFEKHYIIRTLTQHDWHMQQGAAAMGISRVQLWKKIQRYKIEQP